MIQTHKNFRFTALSLVAIMVVIFISQVLFPGVTDSFKLVSADMLTRPWIIVTAIFLHGGLAHLLLNMFALALFGSILETVVGWKKFLLIFFTTGIIANIGASFLYPASLGASGAIFGIIGALAMARPTMVVWVLGVPAPMVIAALVWAIQDVVGLFVPSNVGNLAHLMGLGVGVLMGIPYFQWQSKDKRKRIISESDAKKWEDIYLR